MNPTIGRIVHYWPKVPESGTREALGLADGPFAAIVTRVYADAPDVVDLTIFSPPHPSQQDDALVPGTEWKGCRVSLRSGPSSPSHVWEWPPQVRP